MKDELASSTYQEYSAVLRNHVYPVLGEKPFTGIRQGELIALKASDVDFKNRLIHVQRNLSRGKLKLPKNGKTRKVDMSKQLAGVLQELNRGPDEWLFQSSTKTQIDASNLRKMWERFQKDAELRRIRFHDLRHTFASLHLQNGESPAYVRDQMGHSSIKVTVDIYGHLTPGGNREAADRLDD